MFRETSYVFSKEGDITCLTTNMIVKIWLWWKFIYVWSCSYDYTTISVLRDVDLACLGGRTSDTWSVRWGQERSTKTKGFWRTVCTSPFQVNPRNETWGTGVTMSVVVTVFTKKYFCDGANHIDGKLHLTRRRRPIIWRYQMSYSVSTPILFSD